MKYWCIVFLRKTGEEFKEVRFFVYAETEIHAKYRFVKTTGEELKRIKRIYEVK